MSCALADEPRGEAGCAVARGRPVGRANRGDRQIRNCAIALCNLSASTAREQARERERGRRAARHVAVSVPVTETCMLTPSNLSCIEEMYSRSRTSTSPFQLANLEMSPRMERMLNAACATSCPRTTRARRGGLRARDRAHHRRAPADAGGQARGPRARHAAAVRQDAEQPERLLALALEDDGAARDPRAAQDGGDRRRGNEAGVRDGDHAARDGRLVLREDHPAGRHLGDRRDGAQRLRGRRDRAPVRGRAAAAVHRGAGARAHREDRADRRGQGARQPHLEGRADEPARRCAPPRAAARAAERAPPRARARRTRAPPAPPRGVGGVRS